MAHTADYAEQGQVLVPAGWSPVAHEQLLARVASGEVQAPHHLRKHRHSLDWPARSPDKSPLDYFLWGICEAEIRRVKPKTLDDLKEVVSDFVESLDEEEVRRAVRDVRPRAELCIKMDGGHFESQLKKYKRGTIEE